MGYVYPTSTIEESVEILDSDLFSELNNQFEISSEF